MSKCPGGVPVCRTDPVRTSFTRYPITAHGINPSGRKPQTAALLADMDAIWYDCRCNIS